MKGVPTTIHFRPAVRRHGPSIWSWYVRDEQTCVYAVGKSPTRAAARRAAEERSIQIQNGQIWMGGAK